MSAEHDRFPGIRGIGESILREIVVTITIIVTTKTPGHISVLTESVDIEVHYTRRRDLSNDVSARRHAYLHDNHHSYKITPR